MLEFRLRRYIVFVSLILFHCIADIASVVQQGLCWVPVFGGSARDGSHCNFPFFYKGKDYHKCTSVDHDQKWCGTERYFQAPFGLWGNCADACGIPVTHTLPTPPSACSNPMYDEPFEYVLTTGGTAEEGTKCSFPFHYRGTEYFGCTTVNNHGIPWCSTNHDYSPKIWGNCNYVCDQEYMGSVVLPKKICHAPCEGPPVFDCAVTTVDGDVCDTPFRYGGELYYSCTTRDLHGALWCYTDAEKGTWGYCGALLSKTVTNKDCDLPFNYGGFTYHGCTTAGNKDGLPWCYTNKATKQREMCKDVPVRAFDRELCDVPYKYKGTQYTSCTTKDHHGVYWCYTNASKGRWKNCVATPEECNVNE